MNAGAAGGGQRRDLLLAVVLSCAGHLAVLALTAARLGSMRGEGEWSVPVVVVSEAALPPSRAAPEPSPPAPAVSAPPPAAPAPIAAPPARVRPRSAARPRSAPRPVQTPAPVAVAAAAEVAAPISREARAGAAAGSGTAGTWAAPEYAQSPRPPYPPRARRQRIEGVVLLRVRVRADGRVGEVELARSSGSTLLDESALRTVRDRWRFVPGRAGGRPIESWVQVPLRFELAKKTSRR